MHDICVHVREKALNAIFVTELCEGAHNERNTFCTNFTDISDLLNDPLCNIMAYFLFMQGVC